MTSAAPVFTSYGKKGPLRGYYVCVSTIHVKMWVWGQVLMCKCCILWDIVISNNLYLDYVSLASLHINNIINVRIYTYDSWHTIGTTWALFNSLVIINALRRAIFGCCFLFIYSWEIEKTGKLQNGNRILTHFFKCIGATVAPFPIQE